MKLIGIPADKFRFSLELLVSLFGGSGKRQDGDLRKTEAENMKIKLWECLVKDLRDVPTVQNVERFIFTHLKIPEKIKAVGYLVVAPPNDSDFDPPTQYLDTSVEKDQKISRMG